MEMRPYMTKPIRTLLFTLTLALCGCVPFHDRDTHRRNDDCSSRDRNSHCQQHSDYHRDH
jgi:hypothetical protein